MLNGINLEVLTMKKEFILVTGANGQIGSELTAALRQTYGDDVVLATDIRPPTRDDGGRFEILDIRDQQRLAEVVRDFKVTQIYHLAAILSAKGETNPRWTWQVNMEGLFNILECARQNQVDKVFFPSSIAVFSDKTPRHKTPQHTILHPTTVYGISKAAGEDWCNYYFLKYGVDVRSVRFPGIISYLHPPGGGTTDYAVEIYHAAVEEKPYYCFLREDTRLPMLYMPDAIRATIELMAAPSEQIRVRTSYNLAGMSFTPGEIYAAIKNHYPDFKIFYQPDFRQQIADSWTASIDDSMARKDWGWESAFDLEQMTSDMLNNLNQIKSMQYV